jgi:hypothetical protein
MRNANIEKAPRVSDRALPRLSFFITATLGGGAAFISFCFGCHENMSAIQV